MKRTILLVLASLGLGAAIIAWALSPPRYPAVVTIKDSANTPGSVISVERIGGHNRLVLRGLSLINKLPLSAPISDGAEMFRIRYWSQIDGRPVEASGLLSLPYVSLTGQRPRGTVMYLHGTSPDRSASPSAPGALEGMLSTAMFAGGGYALLAPDYIGVGQSHAGQAYLHAGATAAAARDLITAANRVTAAMHVPASSDLYLVGFSQGGHATAVVQRALEAHALPGTTIKAAAAIAGAFDLDGISVPYALANKHSMYLAYLAHAFAAQYQQPLGSLLVPRYAALVPTLFDGNHDIDAISAALPPDPRTMFRPEILADMAAKRPNWFTMALAENQAFDWQPKAPLRLYFGDRDTDVSPQDSKHFHAVSKALGGNVTLVPVGPHDHIGSALEAVPMARLWFDQLSQPVPAP
jgi:pimeloyl-ACP methyl ester carboxylesterase